MEKGVTLKDNFLSEIIFRIDFTTILELAGTQKESAKKFRNRIIAQFPNLEILQQQKVNLNININKGTTENKMDFGELCWVFRNNKGNKQISLTSNSLILNYHKGAYSGFKAFLTEILLLLSALKEYNHFQINFLGLRYINEITDNEINNNIEQYINPKLFNNKIIDDLERQDEKLIQLFSRLDYQKEDYYLTLQYGFFNPTIDSGYEKHFILDYDCVCKSKVSIDETFDKLKKMNKYIFNKFEYSISEKFVDKMGEEYDTNG
ncbi:TIGR04255 family protein [Methanosphaera sp.]|uniref:TIGR04255 family protein n=1 Tax=Methanosphaera sp. TaxID=2666342 RepID=UPI0025F2B810|nr:TIGR04255 family protein [Methanosphaera sp.]